MKSRLIIYVFVIIPLIDQTAYSQPLTGYSFKIVNMIPNPQSDEVRNDAETNIAVNPANTAIIAGSAFTNNPTGSLTSAPIFISSNGGNAWSLNNILPSSNGRTGDISLGFGSSSGTLYAGILRGGSGLRCMMLRTTTPTANTMMTTLVDRSTESVDQPFVSATTVNDASSTPRERVFSGDNLYGSKKSFGGNGRTAEVMVSNDAASAPPSGLTDQIVEVRNTFEQDMPATRTAIHNSGVVYGVFYSWVSGFSPSNNCDVVVVRDDNFAVGATPFSALLEGGVAGQRVVTNRLVPAFGFGGPTLGSNRLVASNLAIAVDPNNSANVFVAWCDRVSSSDYTVHFRRSTNSGQNWGNADWLAVTNATNPGIAVTTDGKVGLIYQQLTGSGASAQWETHFRFTTITGNSFTDDILARFADSDLNISALGTGFLGDYLRMEAVGRTFYGVFPAGNRANNANFPHSVTYQRNADFTTNQLRNTTNTGNVSVSVDPFFFRISPKRLTICSRFPRLCPWKYIIKNVIRIPIYPCLKCPWPCLQCPPFEFPIEDIYKQAFKNGRPRTVLSIPYFHLTLEGLSREDYDVAVITKDGQPVAQQVNQTDNGYAISFRPSKNNFTDKGDLRALRITIMPKSAEAAKKGVEVKYKFEASDYQFKEFMSMHQ